jgi:hypothetical protein
MNGDGAKELITVRHSSKSLRADTPDFFPAAFSTRHMLITHVADTPAMIIIA